MNMVAQPIVEFHPQMPNVHLPGYVSQPAVEFHPAIPVHAGLRGLGQGTRGGVAFGMTVLLVLLGGAVGYAVGFERASSKGRGAGGRGMFP